jgi:hypothetical protein
MLQVFEMSDESTAARFIESQNERVSHARLPKPTLKDFIESQKKKREAKPKRVKKRAFDPTSDNPLEHVEQRTLFEWILLYRNQIPELQNVFAIPNQGAARLKNLQTEGVLRGVFDVFVAIPRNRKHGLFVELKRVKKWKISAEQIAFGARVSAYEYEIAICHGAESAWMTILGYLGVKDPR